MKANSSAGWKEEGSGGSNARPPRVYGPAVFNDSDPRCNDISVYYRMVDAQERSLMIPCPQYEIWQYCPVWKQIHQSERDAHWRDLFVSDLRSSIKWDAEHGNPELFKVVVTLDKHYNTFSVEQHDKQVRDKVLDEVLQLPQRREQPNGSMYIYVNDVKALRQAGSP